MQGIANTLSGHILASFFGASGPITPSRPASFRKPFHPTINRHTGKPHEHKREIARRTRQAR